MKTHAHDDKWAELIRLMRGQMGVLGMDQRTLAAKVGCCPATVCTKLRRPETLRLDELPKYARALEIPADELRAAIPMR